jgi:PIN domain nuclease of toxin-antitoxin system
VLSKLARKHIEDPAHEKLISPASYWEIAIKISLGKYSLPQPYRDFMNKGIDGNGFLVLPLQTEHAAVLTNLTFHHRDPFDRMIIAQAIAEQISILSGDKEFDAYPVPRIW